MCSFTLRIILRGSPCSGLAVPEVSGMGSGETIPTVQQQLHFADISPVHDVRLASKDNLIPRVPSPCVHIRTPYPLMTSINRSGYISLANETSVNPSISRIRISVINTSGTSQRSTSSASAPLAASPPPETGTKLARSILVILDESPFHPPPAVLYTCVSIPFPLKVNG